MKFVTRFIFLLSVTSVFSFSLEGLAQRISKNGIEACASLLPQEKINEYGKCFEIYKTNSLEEYCAIATNTDCRNFYKNSLDYFPECQNLSKKNKSFIYSESQIHLLYSKFICSGIDDEEENLWLKGNVSNEKNSKVFLMQH